LKVLLIPANVQDLNISMTSNMFLYLELYDPASNTFIVGYEQNALVDSAVAITQNVYQGQAGHCKALTGPVPKQDGPGMTGDYAGLTVCYSGFLGVSDDGGSDGIEFITVSGVSATALEMRAREYTTTSTSTAW
jgi:hypothetical protein